mgnify:CR=1 FL=1
MTALKLDKICKSFGTVEVLKDIDLTVEDGEFVVFVGPSGCGKSTLLRVIAGLEDASAGSVAIGDEVVNNVAPSKRGIAMVFQSYALYPHMTVEENMGFGLKMNGVPKAEIKKKVGAASDILSYNPKSGDLKWKHRDGARSDWNARYAGKLAGSLSKSGYRRLTLSLPCGRTRHFATHRICWLLHYKRWPKGVIDHIDGNPLNNAISNLRDVTQGENCRNRSGIQGHCPGVVKKARKWAAYCPQGGKIVYLGLYKTKAEATEVARAKRLELGFSERHVG